METVTIDAVKGWEAVRDVLYAFDAVFPHLREKIASYDEFAKKLDRYAQVCLARLDGKPCGLLVFYANDEKSRTAYISLIGVHAAYRGRHLGQYLLDYCVRRSLACGMRTLRLEVDRDNQGAQGFYLHNGFLPCGDAGDTGIYMEKQLT